MAMDRPIDRQSVQVPHATQGPTMAIEKMLAPSVVRPPCASNSAWNSSTIAPSKAITEGPNNTAPRPVPVGCEQEPVTLGIFIADRTKVNAPDAARVSFICGCSRMILMTLTAPWATNGADTRPHPMQCSGGRKPSMMCMAELQPSDARVWRER